MKRLIATALTCAVLTQLAATPAAMAFFDVDVDVDFDLLTKQLNVLEADADRSFNDIVRNADNQFSSSARSVVREAAQRVRPPVNQLDFRAKQLQGDVRFSAAGLSGQLTRLSRTKDGFILDIRDIANKIPFLASDIYVQRIDGLRQYQSSNKHRIDLWATHVGPTPASKSLSAKLKLEGSNAVDITDIEQAEANRVTFYLPPGTLPFDDNQEKRVKGEIILTYEQKEVIWGSATSPPNAGAGNTPTPNNGVWTPGTPAQPGNSSATNAGNGIWGDKPAYKVSTKTQSVPITLTLIPKKYATIRLKYKIPTFTWDDAVKEDTKVTNDHFSPNNPLKPTELLDSFKTYTGSYLISFKLQGDGDISEPKNGDGVFSTAADALVCKPKTLPENMPPTAKTDVRKMWLSENGTRANFLFCCSNIRPVEWEIKAKYKVCKEGEPATPAEGNADHPNFNKEFAIYYDQNTSPIVIPRSALDVRIEGTTSDGKTISMGADQPDDHGVLELVQVSDFGTKDGKPQKAYIFHARCPEIVEALGTTN